MKIRQLSITHMSGPRDGDTLTFSVDPENLNVPLVLTIGRHDDTDIYLHFDSQVSRLHAHLAYDGKQFWIEDMGSRNGTYLTDNEKIEPNEKIYIDPGDLFRVGKTWLRLDPMPSDVTAPAEPLDPILVEEDNQAEMEEEQSDATLPEQDQEPPEEE